MKWKRIMALCLAVVLCLSFATVASAASVDSGLKASDFSDFNANAWYAEAVSAAVENGLLIGKSARILDPNGNLTRAEMAAVINRSFGTYKTTEISQYKDVSKNAWYYKDVQMAVWMGTYEGTSKTTMAPEKSITRQEIMTVVARALYLDLDRYSDTDLSKFSDYRQVSDWALPYVKAMVGAGYIQGRNTGLAPQDSITRAEFAQVFYNIIRQYIVKSGSFNGSLEGNLLIRTGDVTLKDTTIDGDLIIGNGAADGKVTLSNVTITGRLVVWGGGTKAVYCSDGTDVSELIAYWFSGCVNLTSAELPSYVFSIGSEAFKGCTKLEELLLYHSQDPEIAEDAFEGGAEMIVYVTGLEALNAVNAVNWHGRSVTAFDLSEYLTSTYSTCGINGCNCSSCSWHYEYDQYDEDTHIKYEQCNNCSANEYAYGIRSAHTYNSSGVCTVCGYTQSASCSHGATYTTWSGCNWYKYCNYCGELVSSGVSHGTYTYGDWEYYSSTQHRRYGTCNDCGGGGKYEYASHATTAQYAQYSDTQHKVTQHCDTCNSDIGSATYESHTYTYGSWTSTSETQHKRTKTCSLCGLSTEETGTHADANADGKCDTCGYSMSVTVTWDAGTNGGKVNGAASVTTSVPLNTTAAAPGYTPTKTGHTFRGWYTSATGGSLYSTVTITAARTFYAQFTANTYTITWDLGDGRTETTQQEYGKVLVLPSDEPTRDTAYFDGWYTEKTGGTEVNGDAIFTEDSNTTYYAHWIEAFSVTVPTVLPLRVDENGEVYATEASISNHSSGIVKISSVTLTGENGWTIVPYGTNMAAEKVDAKLVGLSLNQIETESAGPTETLTLGESWRIFREDTLALTYDAVVSALSQPVTDEAILSAVFVVEWA